MSDMTTHPVNPLVLEALKVAKTQLGVTEIPNNRGPEVKAYLGSVGLGEGYSWCAAFVYWCFKQASLKLDVINPLVKTAGVLNHWNSTTAPKVSIPRQGDIFIMDFGKGMGHTGFVDEVNLDKKTFTTVEGNSNSHGSRTGGMVCSNTREFSKMKGFIRY